MHATIGPARRSNFAWQKAGSFDRTDACDNWARPAIIERNKDAKGTRMQRFRHEKIPLYACTFQYLLNMKSKCMSPCISRELLVSEEGSLFQYKAIEYKVIQYKATHTGILPAASPTCLHSDAC